MVLVKDFIHEYSLTFNEDNADERPKLCKLCGLLMFAGTPFYSCSVSGCSNFFLHKHCADLPQEFTDQESFSELHNPFILLPNPTSEGCMCLECGQICKNFTYCPKRIAFRNTVLHPLCACPNNLETLHRGHRQHPLSPTHRKICAVCSACGEEETGIFFSCQQCDYWLHQDCASLPPVAKHASHFHPLVLLYSYPLPKGEFSWGLCELCGEGMPLNHGVYSCRACNYSAHLKCMKSSLKELTPEESRELIVHLPPSMEDTVFPSLIIRAASLNLGESDATTSSTLTKRMTPKECHNHPLIFHDGDNEISEDVKLCNACIQPILSATPYYSCTESHCHFLVHELCANLPLVIWGKLLGRPMYHFTEWRGFFQEFTCDYCERQCNGFGYSFTRSHEGVISLPDVDAFGWRPPDYWDGSNSFADVECASAPRIIKHESHKNHILQLITSFSSRSFDITLLIREFNCCPSSRFLTSKFFYHCISCDFKIHIRCALLPQQVGHKFDKHLLQLNTNGPTILLQQQSSSDHNFKPENYNFCEFCEKDIDLRYWFYGCLECDNYFHVNCIPSVGKYSKFKFGGTVDDVPCHPHPLTSVRMLTIGSQSCGYCEETVQGFSDNYAFHCFACAFWMQWRCVYLARSGKRYIDLYA